MSRAEHTYDTIFPSVVKRWHFQSGIAVENSKFDAMRGTCARRRCRYRTQCDSIFEIRFFPIFFEVSEIKSRLTKTAHTGRNFVFLPPSSVNKLFVFLGVID